MSISRSQRYSISISNTKINIDTRDFNGEIFAALAFIQKFCNENTVTYKSINNEISYGYGNLIINEKTHLITPYGINFNMMIGFCGGRPVDFQLGSTSEVNHCRP